jgi:hypothetical protein
MAKSEKKAKKAKLPKEVAGVKVPKGLRKAGKAALKMAEKPIVGEAVAAALLGAAAALRETPKGQAKAAGTAVDASAEALKAASGLGDSLRVFALNMARATLDALEEKGAGDSASKAGKGG